jgi:cytoskeletal protein RodZ
METLGLWLRQAREARDETLRDIEEATRIRVRFLEMMEAGDFDSLPGGEVQARGFLRIYARHLGFPPEEAVMRYEAEIRGSTPVEVGPPVQVQPAVVAKPPPEPSLPRPESKPGPPLRSGFLGPDVVLIGAVILVIVLVIIIIVAYAISRNIEQGQTVTPTSVAQATAATYVAAQPLGTAPATELPPDVTPTFPVSPEGGVTLALQATEHVWGRVQVDDVVVFQGMLAADQILTRSGQETVVVETGNGAGLLATVNGQPQGAIGGRGEVSARGWGPEGEIALP